MTMPEDTAATGGYPAGVNLSNSGNPSTPQNPQPTTSTGPAVLEPYKNAVRTAEQTKASAASAVVQLQKQLANTSAQTGGTRLDNGSTYGETDNPEYKAVYDQLIRAMSLYDSAAREHQKALADLADATQKEAARADPTTRAALEAQAALARTQADAAAAQYQEFQQSAPDRKAAIVAKQRSDTLANDAAQADLDLRKNTDPLKVDQLRATADTAKSNAITAKADADVASQTVDARVTVVNQGVKAGEQALTAGDIANQTGTANLTDLLRRVRQAPTDEQAMSALQTALDQGQANLGATQAGTAATQAGTARSQQLLPGEVAQQGATLAGTQANTEAQRAQTAQVTQGTLAGLDDYIKAQKDAIAKGLISPTQADQGLQARLAGTDVFSAAKSANDAMVQRSQQQLEQRSQDIGARNQQAATFGSMADTGLGQFMNLNNTVQPGSDAAGRGLLGYMNLAQQMLGQYSPPDQVQPPPLPPMLQQFAGGPQPGPAAPASPASPAPTTPVTINIGGSAAAPIASGPAPMPGAGVTPAAPGMAQSPALLNPHRPATTADVLDRWRVGPAVAPNERRIYGQ